MYVCEMRGARGQLQAGVTVDQAHIASSARGTSIWSLTSAKATESELSCLRSSLADLAALTIDPTVVASKPIVRVLQSCFGGALGVGILIPLKPAGRGGCRGGGGMLV